MQKIADGKGNAFYAVPGIHGYPGVSVIAGDSTHGKCGTGNNQNDERDDKKQNIDFFHTYEIRFVSVKFVFNIKQERYVKVNFGIFSCFIVIVRMFTFCCPIGSLRKTDRFRLLFSLCQRCLVRWLLLQLVPVRSPIGNPG